MTPEDRKARSIAILKSRDIPYIDHLPVIESAAQAKRRSGEEIARRAIACLTAIQAACDRHAGQYTPENAHYCLEFLQKYEMGEVLTPKEITILNNRGSEQDVINMAWKYEAYWTLLWALGIVPELDYPDHIIDCDFAIHAVASCDNFAEFMAKVRLRDIEDILNEADLIYRYHWACRDAVLNGREPPCGLIHSVVSERHAGLNWLIAAMGNDDWDFPDIST